MKRLVPLLAVVSSMITALSTTAEAAPWQPIDQRKAFLDSKIDYGVRVGTLTRAEAILLRGELKTIANLEVEFRRTGGVLTYEERADLDRRFNALNQKIRAQNQDNQDRADKRWIPLSERKARLYEQIEQGLRKGDLTRAEAGQIRSEFEDALQLEAEYRRSGGVFTMSEQADLETRYKHISLRAAEARRNMNRRF